MNLYLNSLLQISLQGQIHKNICPIFTELFLISFFFEESLTKCESSSGRLLLLETCIRIGIILLLTDDNLIVIKLINLTL